MSVNKPNVILAASMPRSGSTWLFNIARLLIINSRENMADNFSSGWIDDVETIPTKPLMMLKVHNFRQTYIDQASFVFYSFRDVRDALASSHRKFNQEPTLEIASSVIENHERWIKCAGFIMKYEDMANNKIALVDGLAEKLGIKSYDAASTISQVDNMKAQNVNSRNFDPNNLYHEGHITDGRHGSWENSISKELESQIVEKHYDWFKRYGYVS